MKKRKQITFDIDTNVAREILGNNYTNLYLNIKKFMETNDWRHIEGSVYMSNKPLTNPDVSYLLDDLLENYPYLTKCIRDMHQSDISNIHSLENHFEYDGTPGEYAREEEPEEEKQKQEEKQDNSKDVQKSKKAVRRKAKSR